MLIVQLGQATGQPHGRCHIMLALEFALSLSHTHTQSFTKNDEWINGIVRAAALLTR